MFPTLKSLLEEDDAAKMEDAASHFADFIEDILASSTLRYKLEDFLTEGDAAIEMGSNTEIAYSIKVKGKQLEVQFDIEPTSVGERHLVGEMGSQGNHVKVIDGDAPIASRTHAEVPAEFLMRLALNELTNEPLQKSWDEFVDYVYVSKRRVTSVLADSKYYKTYNDPNHADYEDPANED